jgi:hypothetical protein
MANWTSFHTSRQESSEAGASRASARNEEVSVYHGWPVRLEVASATDMSGAPSCAAMPATASSAAKATFISWNGSCSASGSRVPFW